MKVSLPTFSILKPLNFFGVHIPILISFSFLLSCNEQANKDNKTSSGSFDLIDDCNFHINCFKPQRVICIGQHTTELMIKLNLKDKVIGWCFPDSKVQPDLPLISEQYPSKEVMLSLKPDFIFSGFMGAFKDERLGSRESLKEMGIGTYVSSNRCVEGQRAISYEDFFKDILNIGKIFDVEARAKFLVDSLKQEISKAKEKIKIQKSPITVLVFSQTYSNGEVLVAGGFDISTNIIQEAGGANVFQEEKKQELITSVEAILEKNPDVIVLKENLNDPGAILTQKLLEENPVLKNLRAVKNKNYVIVTFDSLLPSLTNIDALKKMIAAFYPDESK